MSKESISRDRWRQGGQANYGDWCKGCGLHLVATGQHRADCTMFPPPCQVCLYHPAVHGRHRDDCPHRKDQAA